MEDDFAYYRRRAADERVAAMKAAHYAARVSHLELADRYKDLATQIEAQVMTDHVHAA